MQVRTISDVEYKRLRKRLAFILGAIGRAHETEDVLNEFCVGRLEGKHRRQSLNQFVIDYLRKSSGRKGSSGYATRLNLANAGSVEASQGRHEFARDTRRDVDARIDSARYLTLVKPGTHRFIFQRYHFEGAKLKEIAEDLGVSESRVSQILTKSEANVAALLTKGLSNKEIANQLFVEEKTIKFHLTNIYAKTGYKTRAEYIAANQKPVTGPEPIEENEMSDWQPMSTVPRPLPAQGSTPTTVVQRPSKQDTVNFIVEKFKVGDTIEHLQAMSKQVVQGDITVEKVMAACACIGRMNETMQTVMKAAQVMGER